jgi:CHAT domain-containing protein/uncharacterized protein HemY
MTIMNTSLFKPQHWLVLLLIIGFSAAPSFAWQTERIVEQLIEEGERLWYLGAFAPALEKSQEALKLSEQLSDPKLMARCLNLMGNVSHSQGDFALGGERHQRALDLAREIGDQQLEGSVLAGIGLGHWRQSNYGQARDYCQQALGLQERIGDRLGQATTLVYIGRVHFKRGDYTQAVDSHRRALMIQEADGDRQGQSITLEDLGDVYQEQGDYAQALQCYQDALRLKEEMEDWAGQCYLLHIVGRCYMMQGAYQEALGYLRRALRVAQNINDRPGLATALYHLGITYSRQGAYARAVECYRGALRIREELGDRRAQAWDLAALGDVHYRQSHFTQALTYYQRATVLWEEIRDWRGLAGGFERTARTYYDARDYRQALEYYQRAEKLRGETQPAFLASTLGNLGRVYAKLGDAGKALDYGQRAVEVAGRINNVEQRWVAAYLLGSIQRELGLPAEALKSFQDSLAIIERLRADIIPVDEAKAGFLEDKQVVYADTISLLLELGRVADALEVAERARARAFLDLLGGRELEAKPVDAKRLAHIRQLQDELRQRTPVKASTGSVEDMTMRGDDLVKVELSRLQQEQPELASLVTVHPPALAQLQTEARRRQTTLVEYFAADDWLFIWVVEPNGTIHAMSSKITRRELGRFVQEMRRSMRAERLRRLYHVLIKPIEPWLPKDPNQLITIIPHGPLFLVSYAALMDDRGRYFIERHTLNYSPAISVLQYTESKKQRVHRESPHLLVVGNPTMPWLPEQPRPLPPLLGAESEAKTISTLYPPDQVTMLIGARAQERLVQELAPGQTMIHLATHGIIRDDEPLESLLALAPEAGNPQSAIRNPQSADGLLTMREVFQLDLYADLVVLSACNTGLGKINGDGVIGLGRAFIYAGTPSVMVSLWRVADIMANSQMEQFYRALKRTGGHKAAALRQAQLETLRKLRQHRLRTPSGKPLAEHPIFWAPFILIGEAM